MPNGTTPKTVTLDNLETFLGCLNDTDDLNNYYTKSDTYNKSEVYNKTESYSKSEVNTAISNVTTSLGSAAEKDVPTSGNASSSQVVLGNDTRLTDSRTPKSHTHTKSQITDFPTLGTAASKNVPSSGNASSSQVVMGNDTRLTDSRKASDVYSWAKASSKPSYSYSEISETPTLGTAASKNVPSSGNASSAQVVMGNDTRLSDSRNASDVYNWAKASTSTFGGIKVGVDYKNVIEGTTGNNLQIKHSNEIYFDTPNIDIPSGTTFNDYWKIGSTYTNYLDYDDSTTNHAAFRHQTLVSLLSANGAQVCNYGNTAYAPIKASAFTVSSSEKVKKNIEDMTEEEANKLLDLRTVKYDYKNELNGTNCYGLIAEEVQEAGIDYPVVMTNDDTYGDIPSLDYSKFVPYLIKVCQMQQKEIDELKATVNELKNKD